MTKLIIQFHGSESCRVYSRGRVKCLTIHKATMFGIKFLG